MAQRSKKREDSSSEGKIYYRIGEVSRITGVKPYVLRYWESEFRWMAPAKSRSKQRLYRKRDIEVIQLIKRLLYDERPISGRRPTRRSGFGGSGMSSNPSGGCSERVTRAISAILGAFFLLCGTLAASAGAASDLCAPWGGEIEPLPSVSDPDPLRAAWARLRAEQLAEAARDLEPRSRALAHRVWRHASCLDPERLDLVHALARTPPVRWFRPPILGVEEIDVGEGRGLPDPVSESSWDLGEPIRVFAARISAPVEGSEAVPESPAAPLHDAREQIAAAEEAVQAARFELALERVERGRRFLETQGLSAERAHLEVLAATAEIALGREEAARESLGRALRAQPELSLDPALHSPKLVRLFEEVRSRGGPRP
jgi:hypothetical protein